LYLLDSEGSIIKRIMADNADVGRYRISWSPNGKYLLFSSYLLDTNNNSSRDLYIVEAGGEGLHKVEIDLEGDVSLANLGWLPSGDQIFFSIGREIYIADMDGGNVQYVRDAMLVDWSPKEDLLAYVPDQYNYYYGVCNEPECDTDIYIGDIEGTWSRKITQDMGVNYLAWSPDSNQIAFVGWYRDKSGRSGGGTFLVNADGSNLRMLNDRVGHFPSWTPSGDYLLVSTSLYETLNLVDISTGQLSTLIEYPQEIWWIEYAIIQN
jgi:Tol biopolymer transport system component